MIIILCAVAVLVVAGVLLKPSSKDKISIETGKVTTISISNSVTATGTVKPVTEIEVGTQVSGIIDKLYVDYNDVVKAGQVIALMDKVTLEAELESSQSQLASSKTEYEYRLKEYERNKTLHDKALVSDSAYDEAEYYYQKALNSYKQAQASIVKVKRNLGYATITSPIDGVVISRAVEEGQTVAAGFETPTLFTIAKNLTEMQVIADVDEADIGQVEEGQRVEFSVDAYPDDIFSGEVEQVRLEATTTSNVVTYEVVINAPNPDLKLKPGLTANVSIFTMEKDNVLSVPTKALKYSPDEAVFDRLGIKVAGIQGDDSGKGVWVKDGNVITRKSVTTGSASGDRTEVSEGVAEGDEVVTGITASAETAKKEASTERSPFMPSGPGDNKKEK